MLQISGKFMSNISTSTGSHSIKSAKCYLKTSYGRHSY
jgi:hypothetical protein